MTLKGMVLKAVLSHTSESKVLSPPPELEAVVKQKRKKKPHKYNHVLAQVDTSPPIYPASYINRHIQTWQRDIDIIYKENIKIVTDIKRYHFIRGKVDSRWRRPLKRSKLYYENRVNFLKRIMEENKMIYNRIISTVPRVVTAKEHLSDWAYHRRNMILMAEKPFVLFPPVPTEDIEDPAFKPPEGVKRPRVHLLLGIAGGAALGELTVELFTDVCPLTCTLFQDLADGDGLGHGYIGTCFYTKVPGLYWSGGDVIHNNGFGCYAQRGRVMPIGAENFHFSHSIPGLVSMRMTRNDEMCGTFNITFKPLQQFDLKNVVFGRIIRPSKIYNAIRDLGSPLSTQPVVEIRATRRLDNGRSVCGLPNIVLQKPNLRSMLRKTM